MEPEDWSRSVEGDDRNEGTETLACANGFYVGLLTVPSCARSKAWVCGRSPAGIGGSNPAGEMYVCLL